MNVDMGRILLDVLAAIVIQFTPVENFTARDRTWTWGDTSSRWYTTEVLKPAADKVVVTFQLYEGEVRTEQFVSLTAVKGADGRFAWKQVRRNGDRKPVAVNVALLPYTRGSFTDSSFVPEPWKKDAQGMKAVSKKKVKTATGDGYTLVYTAEKASLSITISKTGILGFAIAEDVAKLATPEHVVHLENPAGN